ncbi:MAG TPA: glycoside hydrolase family 5 protein [bacterium]|nr:glycoside hydrolase family 5 protein [bacterium]
MELRKILTAASAVTAVLSFLAFPGAGAEEAGAQGSVGTPALLEMSSADVVRQMGLGWNLGDTMESCGDSIQGPDIGNFETAWGNPRTTKEMIDAIRAAGFRSIRIPVAWSNLMGDHYTIDPGLMKRVREIVDWVQADGMIAVVNIHWDGGWWSRFPAEPDKCMAKYERIWTQISANFKDHPGTLIFESLNEEGCFNDVWNRWGDKDPEHKKKAFDILNGINQAFVDIVRKSGGLNAQRHLLIAGYATDIDLTVDPDFLMPKDPAGHCILSVHYYTPFTFAGLEHDESWGKMRSTWGTDADKAELDSKFALLKPAFLDKGIPVIVGEYGATLKNKDLGSVRKYILAVAQKAYSMGMCPMLWDMGSHFDRRTLRFRDAELLKGFRKIEAGKRE